MSVKGQVLNFLLAALRDAITRQVVPQCRGGGRVPLTRDGPRRARLFQERHGKVADAAEEVHYCLTVRV